MQLAVGATHDVNRGDIVSTSSRSKKPQRRQAARPAPRQPVVTRRVVEPPDYSKDYADVRRDIIRIGVLSALLFGGMIGISFFV